MQQLAIISGRAFSLPTRARGLSMIELLIAMVIGLSLAAGVIQIYVGNNQAERNQEARARMQENGRFALNFLSQEIRMAGYLGCLSSIETSNINNTLDGPPPSFRPDVGIQGWEATHGNGTAPGDISNSTVNTAVVDSSSGGWASSPENILDSTYAVPGSDIVRVWNSAGTAGGVIENISGGAMTVLTSTAFSLEDGDVLLLSDCDNADWVQACNVQVTSGGAEINSVLSGGCVPGNDVSQPLKTTEGGEIVKLDGTTFYIGKRGDEATNPPALFRRELGFTATSSSGAAEELVEGIENMQILYGVNSDNDSAKTVDAYLTAADVSDWGSVISVRISVLVQSIEDNLVSSPQPYTFNGVDYNDQSGGGALPPDRRLRRVFTTTINLRNRSVGG